MSAIKNYLENLSVSITDACRNELVDTYEAWGMDSDDVGTFVENCLFGAEYKELYSFLMDCKTDLPWDSITLGVDSALAILEAICPSLKEYRLNDLEVKLCFEGWERPRG